jgi:hypothetical protein
MRKILMAFVLGSFGMKGFSQTIQASIDTSSTKETFKIFLKADASQAPAVISTLQFNVGVDTTNLITPPTLAIVTVNAGLGTGWTVDAPYLEGGFWQYAITTPTSPLSPTFTANTEFEAMELRFTNGDVIDNVGSDAQEPNNNRIGIGRAALVTLPDGGSRATALFYCTGSVASNGLGNLYYSKNGVAEVNQNSYDPSGSTAGTGTSVVYIPFVVLPVKFVSFTATKNKNGAVLRWSVENEDANTAYYEVQKSSNGTDFSSVTTVSAIRNGLSANTYSSSVDNLSAGLVYFRVKQVDKDGKFVFTQVKTVKIDGKNLTAVPNPVKTSTTLSFELEENAAVILAVVDASGKQVYSSQVQGRKGANTTRIDMSKFATGNYTLKVQTATDVQVISVVKASN